MDKEIASGSLSDIDLELLEARCNDLRRRVSSEEDIFDYLGGEIFKEVRDQPYAVLPATIVEFCELESSKQQFAAVDAIAGVRSTGENREHNGKRFWAIYKDRIRKSLCHKNGELYKMFLKEGKTSTKAIIAGLAGTLGIGSMYGGLLCGLAVLLVQYGLEAFCEWTEPDKIAASKE